MNEEAERAQQDFEGHTLAKLGGKFDRLVYLASLRDHNTGSYHHYGLEQRYSPDAVDKALRRCHDQVFSDLLALPLRDQTQDLIHFFESLREDRGRLVEVWQRLQAYQVLPPQDCHSLARQMFSRNVEVMLRVLKESELWELLDESHGDPDNLP
ncbi:MAG: hypothetical protein ACE145_13895 [Terriglobia bacterium]